MHHPVPAATSEKKRQVITIRLPPRRAFKVQKQLQVRPVRGLPRRTSEEDHACGQLVTLHRRAFTPVCCYAWSHGYSPLGGSPARRSARPLAGLHARPLVRLHARPSSRTSDRSSARTPTRPHTRARTPAARTPATRTSFVRIEIRITRFTFAYFSQILPMADHNSR